jgi:flagellar biosynthesis component FlhA
VSSSGGLSTEAIVGIVIGGIVALIFLIIIGVLVAKRGSARVSDYSTEF